MRGTAASASGLTVGGCELHELIGSGGNGHVYRATQTAVGRDVAVKLSAVIDADPAQVARFRREAKMAGALDHPHSLPIYAAGEEDGLLYLVMPLVDGPDLGQLIKRDGPLRPERAVELIAELAGALDAAHRIGLVHRDVKPANVLIDERHGGHAYLSDFGLMRGDANEITVTELGQWLGTVDYMSPEQCEGGTADACSDIYALTGVLYTALTGLRPYVRDSPAITAYAHLHEPPPTVGDTLSRSRATAIDAVIATGMAKRPDDRYPSATALADAARMALGVGVAGSGAPGSPPPVAGRARADGGRTQVGRRRRPLLLAGAALLVVAAAAVVAIVLSGGGGREKSGPRRSATTLHTGSSFSFRYPSGWTVAADSLDLGAFERTQVQSPDGGAQLIIDRTPGQSLSPQEHAEAVIAPTARTTSGYRLVASHALELGGEPAWIWEFTVAGAPSPARADVFLQRAGSGYGVLAEEASLAAARKLALDVAGSLRPR